ncbi:MAG: hypothetical protein ACOCTU_07330 [Bacteroidota bacterium]
MNYFKSSNRSPDHWLSKASDLIEESDGNVYLHAKGMESGRTAYLMEFSFGEDRFRAVWPVLPCRQGNEKAAERQAATMLYHDVKNRCMKARIFGSRTAFFDFLMLPDGRTAAMASSQQLMEFTPKLLKGHD